MKQYTWHCEECGETHAVRTATLARRRLVAHMRFFHAREVSV